MMKTVSFDELRHIAISEGIKDDKTSIGIWAKMKWYLKIRKRIDKKVVILYII